MDLHGGHIGVSSEGPGRGCIFEFALCDFENIPTKPPKNNSSSKVAPAPHLCQDINVPSVEKREPSTTFHDVLPRRMTNLCILIVDDSKLNRKFMTRLLSTSNADLKVIEAEDGVAALEILGSLSTNISESKVDVILMDVCHHISNSRPKLSNAINLE